jgi:Domain of unknown function (DUF397)
MFLPDQIASRHRWRKARRSANDGACVEVALINGQVAVRDSKHSCGSWLRYSTRSWRDFTLNLKAEGSITPSEK